MIRAYLARRRADADRRVLAALRHSTAADAYDLHYRTGLGNVRLGAALGRLMGAGLVVKQWRRRPAMPPYAVYRVACPCGANTVGATAHEPTCREAT